jgi:hypothetical protein
MATTITSRYKFPLGSGIVLEVGDYASDGSTTMTLNVGGGYVIGCLFFDGVNDIAANAGTASTVTLSSKSGTNPVTYTLTPGGAAVTAGGFAILHGGN